MPRASPVEGGLRPPPSILWLCGQERGSVVEPEHFPLELIVLLLSRVGRAFAGLERVRALSQAEPQQGGLWGLDVGGAVGS